jgi:hypothetical protein
MQAWLVVLGLRNMRHQEHRPSDCCKCHGTREDVAISTSEKWHHI